jgi:hypothetical protein
MKTATRNKFSVRHLIAGASLSVLMMPVCASASDDIQQSITLQATVEKTCIFDTLFDSSVTIPIADSAPVTTPIELSPAAITCNTPTDIELVSTSGGIAHEAHGSVFLSDLPDTHYASGINYIAEITSPATGADPVVTLDTSSEDFGNQTTTAFQVGFDAPSTAPNTQLTLTITPQAIDQNKVLRGGVYEDTLTIIISPQ